MALLFQFVGDAARRRSVPITAQLSPKWEANVEGARRFIFAFANQKLAIGVVDVRNVVNWFGNSVRPKDEETQR
jgi:hypothetical protein